MDRILADLEQAEKVEDLVLWLQTQFATMRADEAFTILERLIAQHPDATVAREKRREYLFHGLSVDAATWAWKNKHGN